MPLPLLALPLLMAVSSVARAGLPVELPPGEYPAVWAPALLMAQQLLPELELGAALGPGPSVRIVASAESWLLDVAGVQGRRSPVGMPIPQNDEARMELLLVCADLLAREARPSEVAPPAAPATPPTPTPWSWLSPRIEAGLWWPVGADPQAAAALEPGGPAWHGVGTSARVTLSSPVRIDESLSLRSTHLTLAVRDAWGHSPSVEAVLEGGVGLRRVLRGGREALRDWTPAFGAGVGLGWPIPDGWRMSLVGSVLTDLPPAVLVTTDGEQSLPSLTAQVSLGVLLPSMDRRQENTSPSPPSPWGPSE